MKNLKFILSIFSLFLFLGTGFGQSAKMVQKATDKVEKLNASITSVDASLALNEAQMEKITSLYAKLFKDIKAIKKTEATEEEMTAQKKALRKEINKEINKNILTKEQRQAKKAAKEQSKG